MDIKDLIYQMRQTNDAPIDIEAFTPYSQKSTELPMVIQIDDFAGYKENNSKPCIKFQLDYDKKFNIWNTAYMTISDNPEVLADPLNKDMINIEINDEDVEELKKFVQFNKDTLLKVASQEVDISELENRFSYFIHEVSN